MLQKLINYFKPKDTISDLAKLLAYTSNKEEFLGVKAMDLPDPAKIQSDAAKLAKYSHSSDYTIFAREAWARVLNSLDIILDDKTTDDKVKFHRGVVKATLDLLRLSHQARSVQEMIEKEAAERASLQR